MSKRAGKQKGAEKKDPTTLFLRLFERAQRTGIPLPEAMALATADANGKPSVRYVLLKGADLNGFVFYTNTRSRKGADLEANPYASAAFYWHPLGMQVRVSGRVELVSAEEADLYWQSRPRQSQLAAWASRQSEHLIRYESLMRRWKRLQKKYTGRPVPRPSWWNGYCIVPAEIELWTRRPYRLHERELFVRTARGWRRTLLQP